MTQAEISNTETKKELAIEDQAAHTHFQLMPLWKKLLSGLSSKAKDRVINAVMEFPLSQKDPKFQNKKEFELFKMGCTILDCKTIMISSIFEEKMKKETNEEKKEEENGETNKE